MTESIHPIPPHAGDDQFKLLFELNPVPMLVNHADSLKLLAVNQAALDLYGLEREAMLKLSLEDLIHPDESALFDNVRELLPGEGDHRGIWRHQHRDGATLFLECVTRTMKFDAQAAQLTVLRDVTFERRAVRAMESSEKRFRDLFEHTLGCICVHDLEGIMLSINPAAASSLGYSVGELLDTDLGELIPGPYRQKFPDYLLRLRANGSDRGLLVLRHRDGSLRTWQYHNRLFVDAEGVTSVMASAQNITELRAAQQAAHRSEQQMRMIADALPLRLAYLNQELRLEFVNSRYETYFGQHRDALVGKRLDQLLGAHGMEKPLPYLQRALGGQRQQFELERAEADQRRFDEVTLLPEFAEDGKSVLGIYAMAQDITDRKAEKEHLVRQAQSDALTALPNRYGFSPRLQRAMERARDQHMLLALMYLDLDGFKPVNDRYGHAVGDLVLQAFAGRLRATVRSSDVAARLGGDEFGVLMEGLADQSAAIAMAERILATVASPFVLRDGTHATEVKIGISIGIALLHQESSDDAQMLAQRADEALYEAKRGGRGIWRLAQSETGLAAPALEPGPSHAPGSPRVAGP